jgi:hypothetical protein
MVKIYLHDNQKEPLLLDIVDANCSACWPICGYTYVFLRRDYIGSCAYEIVELERFFNWVYTSDAAATGAM